MEEDILHDEPVPAQHAGLQLRTAREAKGLDIAQVAAETRIPQRHLQAIEDGDYARLPARTYAIGFSRTYARVIGLNEIEIVEQVRQDLAAGSARAAAAAGLEPGDPARVPSRALAWFAVLAALILGAGVFAFYRSYFIPGLGPAPLSAPSPKPVVTARPAAAAAAPQLNGPVVFTSLMDDSWISFYDGKGTKIFEGIMAKGQSFTIPANADNPMVRTGRPYAFAITVGGQPVAKLSEDDTVIKDVPVSAAALGARPPAPANPVPSSASATGATANPPAASSGTPSPALTTRPSAAPTPQGR